MGALRLEIPEPGQLVDIRHRRFVVTEVQTSSLPTIMSDKGIEKPMHLVSLSSLEDDAMGEELQVLWEVEPGVRIFEKAILPAPQGFDDPKRLDAFLNAVQWGVVSSADISALQSPFRSGIDIEDYQLDPVVRALRMPRVNLLIADDVGLGKTIETGLVVQELLLRHRARTILVICPSSLQIQWKDQMRDKFGLEFRIVDSSMMKELRRERGLHVNPWTHFPRLITSIDFIKRDRSMRLFREVLPAKGESTYPRRFDVLIVDEAHNVAPSGTGNYAVPSLRTKTIQALTKHFEHKLFLTATPHNGYQESFSALLELLDDQRFARSVRPTQAQLGAVMVRRLKSELPPKWDGSPRFPVRKIAPMEVEYTEDEKKAHKALFDYASLRRQGLGDGSEKYATEFVLKLLKKRLFSSPAAFLGTLEQHLATIKDVSRKKTNIRNSSIGILKRRLEEIEEDFADDEAFEEDTIEAVDDASSLFSQLKPEETSLLEELHVFAKKAARPSDSKANALIAWLKSTLMPDKAWNNERVLIFTEYRTTQKWLYDLFAAGGLAKDERCMLLYGGMDSKERERIKNAFQASPEVSPVRILLATDAASEGIDLQNHCHRLIHYEIPWNPNRLEQRNGRLDRHGQKAPEVLAYHFVGKGFDIAKPYKVLKPGELMDDLEFLMRAVNKVEQIREDLGKVGPVIASQVEEAMLGIRNSLDTRLAEEQAAAPRRQLKFERDLRDQISKLHDELMKSRTTLRISPENILSVVSISLELSGQPQLTETKLDGVWPDPTGQRSSCPVFKVPALRGTWARCAEGIPHPHTGEMRPITFDHTVANGRDDVVLVHLNHRLVQMATRLLRAEIWSAESRKNLHRITARLLPEGVLDSPAVIAFGRLVVLGKDNHRLHEELISAGGVIREGRFRRLNVTQTQDAVKAALPQAAPDSIKNRLRDMWGGIEPALIQSLDARMADRTKNLQNFLEERAKKESDDIRSILNELGNNIRKELGSGLPEQLLLWPDPEREALERNRDAIKARLDLIPEEIEREVAAIKNKYIDPTPRLFPVAVMFLVPQNIVRMEQGA